MYWCYKYKWCFIDILHITAFHSCRILSKKLGGPLIISQAAGWTIQRTEDHWRGHFDWQTEIRHIYDVLLESCISQLSIDLGYSTWSWVVLLSYHKQPDGPSMHRRSLDGPLWLIYWGSTYIWCTVRVLHITNSQMFHSMHWRSSQALLWLMHWGYTYTVYGVLLEWCISQLFIDVRYSRGSLVVPSSYRKQLDGLFNAPEIIRGAALTDVLMLQI